MNFVWLSFTPSNQPNRSPRAGRKTVGAHAFSLGTPRSLCGFVGREKAGDPAGIDSRHCMNCERVIARSHERIAEQTRHDVAASVARHAGIDERTEP